MQAKSALTQDVLHHNFYLPITVYGEDIVVDYKSKVVIFPNRSVYAPLLSAKHGQFISSYLKMEGYLDEWPSFGPSQVIPANPVGINVVVRGEANAKVLFTRNVGSNENSLYSGSCVLVGYEINNGCQYFFKMGDFEIENFGVPESWGTSQCHKFGWVVYNEFHGIERAQVCVRYRKQQAGDGKVVKAGKKFFQSLSRRGGSI